MSEFIEVLVMTEKRGEAETMAKILVSERLAACVQIDGPVQSLYRWKGKIEKSEEFRLSIKSRKSFFEKLAERIKMLHSYDCPQIVAVDLTFVSKDYASWLDENLA